MSFRSVPCAILVTSSELTWRNVLTRSTQYEKVTWFKSRALRKAWCLIARRPWKPELPRRISFVYGKREINCVLRPWIVWYREVIEWEAFVCSPHLPSYILFPPVIKKHHQHLISTHLHSNSMNIASRFLGVGWLNECDSLFCLTNFLPHPYSDDSWNQTAVKLSRWSYADVIQRMLHLIPEAGGEMESGIKIKLTLYCFLNACLCFYCLLVHIFKRDTMFVFIYARISQRDFMESKWETNNSN